MVSCEPDITGWTFLIHRRNFNTCILIHTDIESRRKKILRKKKKKQPTKKPTNKQTNQPMNTVLSHQATAMDSHSLLPDRTWMSLSGLGVYRENGKVQKVPHPPHTYNYPVFCSLVRRGMNVSSFQQFYFHPPITF